MHKDTAAIMKKLCSSDKTKHIVELGAGLMSSPMLRKISKQKGKGFVLSIESEKYWKNKVEDVLPADKYGKIILSKFYYDEVDRSWKYDYVFKKKYDVILVDGPPVLQGNDATIMRSILQKESSPIGNSMKNGSQSIHMLQYVLPAMHKDSIVVLDGRVGSMLHWVKNWSDTLDFHWYGKAYDKKILKGQLKKDCKNLADLYPFRKVTVVSKKGSDRYLQILGDPRSKL